MKKIRFDSPDFEKDLRALYERPSFPPEVGKQAAAIIEEVRADGDAALIRFAEKFDHVTLSPDRFRVGDEEIEAAKKALTPAQKRAIRTALAQVRTFAKRTMPRNWQAEVRPGVTLGEKFEPLDRVGVYIPGGTAPLVSTVGISTIIWWYSSSLT